MKKIIWVCVASLLVFIIGACARMGKDPEGLVKKNKEEISDKEADSFLANEDSGNDLQEDNKVTQQNVSLYFLDKENNDLVCETRNIMIPDATVVFDEIISSLIRGPQSDDLQPVISKSTKVVGAEKTDNVLKVDLSKDFLESEDLIIARTALVNTLTQLEDVEYVKIDIEGQELTRDGTEDGDIFGVLSKSTNNVDELIATESRKDGLKEVSRELFFSDCGEKYLLSEIRPIKVIDGQVAKAIVEELIKGPINASEGLYSVIPKGTQLLDVELIEEGESNIVALYFSKEFKAAFKDPEETPEETENREAMVLSSIVYSLKELPKVKGIKIYYENSYGNYTDIPLHKIDLKKPLNTRDFPGKLGRKLKIYFANTGSTHLVPNYRSMARTTKGNLQIASAIIDELVMGPWASPEQIGVIPPDVEKGDIKVWMDETNARVMVDLPSSKLDESKIGETGSLMALYAMVNSLTDPVNTSNIKEVQFLVDGNVVKDFGNVELSQPFIRNPAIIQK